MRIGLGLKVGRPRGRSNTDAAPSDSTPNAFTFTDVVGSEVSTVNTSNTITVTGIDTTSAISITGGTYSVNGGAYTAVSGSVSNNDTVAVRVTSSASAFTDASAVLTIGGVSDTYTVKSLGADIVTNGTFTTDTTGWTPTNSTLAAVSGELRVTPTANFGDAGQFQGTGITIGSVWRCDGQHRSITGTVNPVTQLYSGATLNSATGTLSTSMQAFSFDATATATSFTVYCGPGASGSGSALIAFDNIRVRRVS